MILLRCPKFLRCLTADAGNFDRGHSLTSLPLPLAALSSLPTSSRVLYYLQPSVGATLAVARPDSYRVSYNVSLRSQCAHWLWQSATPVPLAPLPKGGWHGKAVTGGFFPRTPGRAHGPCPTRCCVIGAGRTGASAPTRNSVGGDDPVAVPKISALPYGGRWKF